MGSLGESVSGKANSGEIESVRSSSTIEAPNRPERACVASRQRRQSTSAAAAEVPFERKASASSRPTGAEASEWSGVASSGDEESELPNDGSQRPCVNEVRSAASSNLSISWPSDLGNNS